MEDDMDGGNEDEDTTSTRHLVFATPSTKERLKRARQPLDFTASSTAVDPAHAAQDTSTRLKTGRHGYTENATSIGGDLPAESDRWDTLNEANRDFHTGELEVTESDGSIKQAQRKQDLVNDTVAWGNQIELTDHEIARAVYIVEHADPDTLRANGSAVILAALTIVANEDHGPAKPKIIRRSAATIASNIDWMDDHQDMIDTFETIRTDLGISLRSIRTARQKIRETIVNP